MRSQLLCRDVAHAAASGARSTFNESAALDAFLRLVAAYQVPGGESCFRNAKSLWHRHGCRHSSHQASVRPASPHTTHTIFNQGLPAASNVLSSTQFVHKRRLLANQPLRPYAAQAVPAEPQQSPRRTKGAYGGDQGRPHWLRTLELTGNGDLFQKAFRLKTAERVPRAVIKEHTHELMQKLDAMIAVAATEPAYRTREIPFLLAGIGRVAYSHHTLLPLLHEPSRIAKISGLFDAAAGAPELYVKSDGDAADGNTAGRRVSQMASAQGRLEVMCNKFWDTLSPSMFADWDVQAAANVLWARGRLASSEKLGGLRGDSREPTQDDAQMRDIAAKFLPEFEPHQVSGTVRALAILGVMEGETAALVDTGVARTAPQMTGPQIANTLDAYVIAAVQPSAASAGVLREQLSKREICESMRPAEAARTLRAVDVLKLRLPEENVTQLLGVVTNAPFSATWVLTATLAAAKALGAQLSADQVTTVLTKLLVGATKKPLSKELYEEASEGLAWLKAQGTTGTESEVFQRAEEMLEELEREHGDIQM